MGSKAIKRDSGIGFLVKFYLRRAPQSRNRENKALALVNGLLVFTEDLWFEPNALCQLCFIVPSLGCRYWILCIAFVLILERERVIVTQLYN